MSNTKHKAHFGDKHFWVPASPAGGLLVQQKYLAPAGDEAGPEVKYHD